MPGQSVTSTTPTVEGPRTMAASESLGQYSVLEVNSSALVRELAGKLGLEGQKAETFYGTLRLLHDANIVSQRIFRAQADPLGLAVRDTVGSIAPDGDSRFSEYLEAMDTAGGLYDSFERIKIVPSFTEEDLRDAYQKAQFRNCIPGHALSLDDISRILFDPECCQNRSIARGFYPAALDDETARPALLETIRGSTRLRGKYTNVVDTLSGPVGILYSETYRAEITEISQKLHQAALLLELLVPEVQAESQEALTDFANQLRIIGNSNLGLYTEYPYSPGDRARASLYRVGCPIFYNNEFSSQYAAGDLLGLKMVMSGYLSVETEEGADLRDALKWMQDNIQTFEDAIPHVQARRADVPAVPIISQSLISTGGKNYFGAQGIAVTFNSDEKKVNDEVGVVILISDNLCRKKAMEFLRPIADVILPEETINYYGEKFDRYLYQAWAMGIASHEQRHFIGDQAEESAESALRGDSSLARESAAEIGRAYSYRELAKCPDLFEMDESDRERYFYDTYLLELFRHINMGANIEYGRSAEMRLNYFIQNGAVEIDDQLKVRIVDYQKFKDCAKESYGEHLEVLQYCDPMKWESYRDQYSVKEGSELRGQIDAILERVRNNGARRDITVRYIWD